MTEIDRIVREIKSLKPISTISYKVMEIMSDPTSSLDELVGVIKYDQATTANLLRICNSSYFGLRKEIASVKQAVAYLGVEKVACLVAMVNSGENFRDAQAGYDLDEGDLWRYSVSSALIAQDLAEKYRIANPAEVFTAALLKDIGKVILSTHVRESFDAIMREVEEEGLTFLEAERKVIGMDHAELGARVAEYWNFAPPLVDIIRDHHRPDRARPNDLSIPIVYLADSICMMSGIGGGSDGLAYRYYRDVVDRLKFSEMDLQMTIINFQEKLKGIEELIKLAQGDE